MKTVKAYLVDYICSNVTGYDSLQRMAEAWDKKHGEYLDGKKKYNQGVAKYNAGKKAYEAGKAEYLAAKVQYEEGLKQYTDGVETYKQGASALSEAKQKRQEGKERLEEGESQYSENLAKYEDGVQKQDEAKDQVSKLPESRWIIMNCRGNSSFVQLMLGSSNLASLEMTFSLMFVLVGALVIYATIGKMIDEKVCLEGMFTICLRCIVSNGKHVFRTQSDGLDVAKTPIGMFEDLEIPNDLAMVDKAICEYYEIGGKTE
jgi:exonuclease VII small subunit